jgi:glycosyltransferase involved in cell wall biosynthesis
LRIAQLTYSYKPITGGADAYAELLCRTLRERGHEVLVYQRAAGTDDPFVRTAPGWQRRLRPRDFWLVPLWLRGIRRELAAMDVLIAHYPNYCRAAEWHPRLIGLSHGVTWDDAPGTWRSGRKRQMALDAFRRCRRYVANDTFFLREMGLRIGPGERPFEEIAPGRWFIPNCVDTSVFRPLTPLDDTSRPPVIIVPRNLYRNRGVHLAVAAFAEVAGDFPGYEMHVVGAVGQPAYAREVERQVAATGLASRVRFLGSVPWGEMAEAYSQAQACLIPSLCGEGTSLAALEAMACGVATITTDAGGLPDLPGIHCQPTASALACALRDVLPRWPGVGETQRQATVSGFHLGLWQTAWAKVVEEW